MHCRRVLHLTPIDLEKWASALTFIERKTILRHLPNREWRASDESEIEAWSDILDAFLESQNISRQEFNNIFGIPAQNLAENILLVGPTWLENILRSEIEFDPNSKNWLNYQRHSILIPFYPLIQMHAQELTAHLSKLTSLPEFTVFAAEDLANHLLAPFLDRLTFMTQRTFALEINVARMLGELSGSTPEERFQAFCERMKERSNRQRFLQEYSCLTRSVEESLALWRESSMELVSRLSQDWPALQSEFSSLGKLINVSGAAGDLHARGRSVQILSFEKKKLVYKPRSLAIDQIFQNFIQWINSQGLAQNLRTIKIFEREKYGWVEFVSSQACTSPTDLGDFYYRLGVLLALFHITGSTDMHLENVIASGANPVAIDLETLFHGYAYFREPASATDMVNLEMVNSVRAVGILPTPVPTAEGGSFDASALGGRSNQIDPTQVFAVENQKTDEMKFVREYRRNKETSNRPSVSDQTLDSPIDGEKVLLGFQDAYKILIAQKENLLENDKVIPQFKNCTIRVVLRPTRLYQNIWAESWHPDFLRDGLARAKHFAQLWRSTSENTIHYTPSEFHQLLMGDVPYFSSQPAGDSLVGGDGTQLGRVSGLTGWKMAVDRLNKMSTDEMTKQSWYINAALGFFEPSYTSANSLSGKPRNEWIELAVDVGDLVLRSAFVFNDTATWMSSAPVGDGHDSDSRHCNLGPLGDGLYDGLSGVILFLHRLGMATGQPRFVKMAHRALNTFKENENFRREFPSISGFAGLGSEIYLYSKLNNDSLFDLAEEKLNLLEPLIAQDETLDFIGGSAGCILSLLSLAAVRPDSRALEIAVKYGDHLLAKSETDQHGRKWQTLKFQRGFSHGTSGLALALHSLAKTSKQVRFEKAAVEAIQWEAYLTSRGQWTDRNIVNGKHQVSWCHGAAGIALARLKIYADLPTEWLGRQCSEALTELVGSPMNSSLCLCHGEMGNLEALILASRVLPDNEKWISLIEDRKSQLLLAVKEYGFRSGLPYQSENVGLMVGLSGLGYGALRAASPLAVPSVLMLD